LSAQILTRPLERVGSALGPTGIGPTGTGTFRTPRREINNILLLEDIPQVRQWLKSLVSELFPHAFVTECSRVRDALEHITLARFDLALLDLGLPDGSGLEVVAALQEAQPRAQSVVVTIHAEDDCLFSALQAGAFGYLLKDQSRDELAEQLQRVTHGEPPLTPSVARRVLSHFAAYGRTRHTPERLSLPEVRLTDRESDVLLRVAKGYTLPEIAQQLGLSRHTISDYLKNIYRKLNVSSRAEAALEAQRLGLFRPGPIAA
jgi:DNA-binding NarL/FixJ family response regulator